MGKYVMQRNHGLVKIPPKPKHRSNPIPPKPKKKK